MKYAIISDVHGNITALEAVLADAKAQNVDKFLFIGDYASNFPFGNEVVDCIRKVAHSSVVRGNGEDYFTNLRGKDPTTLTHEQFKPIYWGLRSLSAENLDYLINLPEICTLTDENFTIQLKHALNFFYGKSELDNPTMHYFNSSLLRRVMDVEPFTRAELLVRAKAEALANPTALEQIMALPRGIYLFGHNHIQFHMEHEGRIFINPGSCGEPLDCDTRAAYTILSISPDGWEVEERRISLDLNKLIESLHTSGYSAYTPMWSEIITLEIQTGKDFFLPFVIHLIETGKKMNDTQYPVSNEVWEAAIKTWDANKI